MLIHTKAKCKNCDVLKDALSRAGYKYKTKGHNSIIELESLFEEKDYFTNSFPVLEVDDRLYSFGEAMEVYEEPLLRKLENRFSLFPINYDDVYEIYKKSRASYWQPEEISLIKDNFDELTKEEQLFVEHILAFFAASDGIVNENIDVNFSNEIEYPEVRSFYATQTAIEAIHSETYSILLEKYIKDPKKKLKLQNAINTIPCIKKKAEWALKHMSKGIPFNRRILAFAFVEGLQFQGSFCSIYWLKTKNKLPGLCFSNELIARDETLHCDFSILMHLKLKNKLSEADAHEMAKEAVDCEKEFIIDSIPCKLLGMNSDLMGKYIEFVADAILTKAGYNKLYFSQNPFEFMEQLSLDGKANFFEKRNGNYAKSGVMSENTEIGFDEDF